MSITKLALVFSRIPNTNLHFHGNSALSPSRASPFSSGRGKIPETTRAFQYCIFVLQSVPQEI
eukprot:3299468-Rhodomonas_salina.1